MTVIRRPAGAPTGGQFAPAAHPEGDVALGPAGPAVLAVHPQDLGLEVFDWTPERIDELLADLTATESDLLEVVDSPAVNARALNRLSEHDRPEPVRLAVAMSSAPGAADRAAEDPSPLVRAASLAGWDLSEGARRRVDADSHVRAVLTALTDAA